MNTLPSDCIMVVNISDNFIETVVAGCNNVKKSNSWFFLVIKTDLAKISVMKMKN